MNERIRELQSKSYLLCKQIVDDDGHVVVTPDLWFDKFAELIVKEIVDECAKVCVQHAGWTPRMIAEQVKQHFGVE